MTVYLRTSIPNYLALAGSETYVVHGDYAQLKRLSAAA